MARCAMPAWITAGSRAASQPGGGGRTAALGATGKEDAAIGLDKGTATGAWAPAMPGTAAHAMATSQAVVGRMKCVTVVTGAADMVGLSRVCAA